MAQPRVDPDLERTIIEYENLEKQLQIVVIQKNQLQLQLNEVNLAGEEIKKATGEIYKSIGSVMVRSTREDAEKDLKERKDLIEIRLNTLLKQEDKLRTSITGLQKKLQEKMRGMETQGSSSGVA